MKKVESVGTSELEASADWPWFLKLPVIRGLWPIGQFVIGGGEGMRRREPSGAVSKNSGRQGL